MLPANAFVFAVRAQAIRNAQLSGCFGYDYDLHETTGKFVQSKKVCNEQSGSINTETSELVPAVPKEPRQLPCLSSLLARLYLLQAKVLAKVLSSRHGFIHYRRPLFLPCCAFSSLLRRLRAALGTILQHKVPVVGSNH